MSSAQLGKKFHARFAGLERAHGTYEIGAGTRADAKNKVKGRALTKLEPVTQELWVAHLEGAGAGLGIVPIRDDNTCTFGAIDVDAYTGLDLAQLEARCLALKLPLVICRSKSGGAHLYLFMSEPVPASEVRGALVEWAVAVGHPKSEVFPKQVAMASANDVGNWINMPYFDAGRTTRYAVQEGEAVGPEEFIKLAAQREVSREELAELRVVPSEGLEHGPPCLQYLAREGFGEGGRNNALFNLGVYCRLRANEDSQWLNGDETWDDALRSMNDQYMSPPLDKREVREVVQSLKRRNYFYLCNMPPINAHCNKDLCRQRRWGIGHGRSEGEAGAPTFTIENPRRVLTEPVTWIVTINALDMELTTEELMDQVKFRRKAIEKLKLYLPPIRERGWQGMVQHVVSEAHDMQAPDDAGPEGRLLVMLEAFCTNHAEARARDELLLGRPWTEDGRTFFRGVDFMRYLDQHHFRDLKERAIWAALRRRGAEHKRLEIKGKSVTCWSVSEFSRLIEELTPADVRSGEF